MILIMGSLWRLLVNFVHTGNSSWIHIDKAVEVLNMFANALGKSQLSDFDDLTLVI